MISRLKGQIALIGEDRIVLDVAGVGYDIKIPNNAAVSLPLGAETAIWTHLAVRENSLELFGFLTYEHLVFFEKLLTVSGIGPRSALSILNLAPLDELYRGIGSGDANYLTKISGIGRKTAQKIVLELKDKIGITGASTDIAESADALDALIALGYSQSEAREALRGLPPDIADTNKKIREALKLLGKE
jgi:Holliday junction DNA helicase RuvA